MTGAGFDPRTIRAAYAAVADDYVADFGDDLARHECLDLERRLLDRVADHAAPAGRVLDVGCGPAQVGRYLAARDVDVIGIDLTQAMLCVAREGLPRLAVLEADLRALPVKTGSVAAITAFYVLQHLPRSELQAALGELRRVLRRGGLLLVVVHQGEGEFQPAAEITATRYTENELAQHCDRASCRVESVHHRGPLPHEHQGNKCSLLARAV